MHKEPNEKTEVFDRRLGLAGATNIGLGAILGGGIYVVSGAAAGMIGPSIILAYFITGLMTLFSAVNYSELAASIPKQGGGYTYVNDTCGGFPGFLTGWFLFIGSLVGCGVYAIGVAHTLAVFIPESTEATIGLIAIVVIAITFITNVVSIGGVSRTLGLLNVLQVVVLFSFIFFGFVFIQPANIEPFFKPGTTPIIFMEAVSFLYISFVGIELITTVGEEVKNPAKNIPRAILLTLLIATAIYMVASLVIVGVVPYTDVQDTYTPIAYVYGVMLGPGAFALGLAGMAASNYAALNATFLAATRVAYSLGRDRCFPTVLDRVSPRFKTPLPALVLTLILVSIFAASGNVIYVVGLSNFGYLIGLTFVNASVILLRTKNLSVPGTFKARFYPLFPIVGVVTCLILVPFLNMESLFSGGLLAVVGLLLYILYGRKRSRRQRIRVEKLNQLAKEKQ